MSREDAPKIMDIEGLKKSGDEIGILVDIRGKAPDMWCREYTQSLINQRKLNVIEYCESLIKKHREDRK
jgi:hypothetical protein